MSNSTNKLKDLFDWEKHPENVFIFTIPLALIGFLCTLIYSILMIIEEGNWLYLCTIVSILGLGTLALIPLIRRLRELDKWNAHFDHMLKTKKERNNDHEL